eukprot:ANDGO_00910.mRNA.1 putative serine/threonine-protein kinase nek3
MSRSSLSDFEILREIGRGSYGVVFKVRRKTDGLIYVIKQINISQLSEKEQHDAVSEVKILGSISSPHVVRYYDSFIDDGKLNIVMEIAEHGSLHDLIRRSQGKKLLENTIWNFSIQICIGLYHIHTSKVLHRDIKSMNIFLDSKDQVKIGDFGVAKVLETTSHMADTLVGTPYYLSPELCENKPYNSKSDVWALGCILYELTTLKHPFDAANQGALILKIVRGKYPPIPSVYSAELRELVDICLSRNVAKRPTVEEILRKPSVIAKARALKISTFPSELLTRNSAPPSSSRLEGYDAKVDTGASGPRDNVNNDRPPRPASASRRLPPGSISHQPRVRARPGLRTTQMSPPARAPVPVHMPPAPSAVLPPSASSSNVPVVAVPPAGHKVYREDSSVSNISGCSTQRNRVSIRDLQREEARFQDIADVGRLPDIPHGKVASVTNNALESEKSDSDSFVELSDDDVEIYEPPSDGIEGQVIEGEDVKWNVSEDPSHFGALERKRLREINALLDRCSELRGTLEESLLLCQKRIGVAKTKEVLDFLRSIADENDANDDLQLDEEALERRERAKAEEVHRFVFGRIAFTDADLITMFYKVLYCENEMRDTECQITNLIPSNASLSKVL